MWMIYLSKGKLVVNSKCLYKIKHAANGIIKKYTTRFVAHGFSQVEGVDYDETFAPVATFSLIRAVMSIVAEMCWTIHQMDVKTAFLNGFLQEEVYLERPQGFEVYERDSHVCRLKKGLVWSEASPSSLVF